MVQPGKIAILNAASCINWWKMAGVEYNVDASPFDWLQDQELETKAANPNKTSSLPQINTNKQAAWSQSLQQIVADISETANVPGTGYGRKSVSPVGHAGAKLMVIGDLPDIDDIEIGKLGEGSSGQLLRQMIAAIGIKFADCYYVSLALSRPASGEIPTSDLPELALFALHQMKLVNPQCVLVLGSVACLALLNAELMTARGNLLYFNHDGQKVASIVTFHPRTLLARPILKAQAWKDLQMVKIEDGL
jgi:uracil-DNA glycosylase